VAGLTIRGYRFFRGFHSAAFLIQATCLSWQLTVGHLAMLAAIPFLIISLSYMLFYTRMINRLSRQVNWAHVREMEQENFGQAYHDLAGNPEGTVIVTEIPEPRKCYCDYCYGRAGVHGDEAVRLYHEKARAMSGMDSCSCPVCCKEAWIDEEESNADTDCMLIMKGYLR
jgi:hypothetical protein